MIKFHCISKYVYNCVYVKIYIHTKTYGFTTV